MINLSSGLSRCNLSERKCFKNTVTQLLKTTFIFYVYVYKKYFKDQKSPTGFPDRVTQHYRLHCCEAEPLAGSPLCPCLQICYFCWPHSRDCIISAVFEVNPFPKAAFGEAVGEVSQLTGAKQPGCQ